MIRYALRCADGHDFDSWFANAAAFDDLKARGLLSCAVCGRATVEKSLMTPRVTPSDIAAKPPEVPSLATPLSPAETALARLRAEVEAKSEYVGVNFVTEARAMHEGTTPERAIYGEAKPEEARKLLEEGVPVMPLPFLPVRKTN